jgi:3,4-dihydroxy 2-butanone 4-phosphate synthase/GTP cyclohydrolase II
MQDYHSDAPRHLDIQPRLLERVETALADVRAGKMVILVDDEDRENEGDLTMSAEKVTPAAINFMAKFGRGLICLALPAAQVDRLQLPMMTMPGRSKPPLGTAFTMSIEAREGVTTGISAADRSHTVQVAISPSARPDDLVTPGHVFPLRARRGGVLVRAGQTEGSVDLARLAGLNPAGVICEIMNDDGTMARMPDLERFADTHGLRILTIADLIAYRLQTELLVRRLEEEWIVLGQTGTEWRALVYEATLQRQQFLVLVKGEPNSAQPVLCRMHPGSTVVDTFGSAAEGYRNLRRAVERIEREGCGILVYLTPSGDLCSELRAVRARHQEQSSPMATDGTDARAHRGTLREYGLGAQVLRELGLGRIRLLTNNPRKIAGLKGYGLQVVETIALDSGRS